MFHRGKPRFRFIVIISLALLSVLLILPGSSVFAGGRACAVGVYYVTYIEDGTLRHAGNIVETDDGFHKGMLSQDWSDLDFGSGNYPENGRFISSEGKTYILHFNGNTDHHAYFFNMPVTPYRGVSETSPDMPAFCEIGTDLSGDISMMGPTTLKLAGYVLPAGYELDDVYYEEHDFEEETTITISAAEAAELQDYVTDPRPDSAGTKVKVCFVVVKKTGVASHYPRKSEVPDDTTAEKKTAANHFEYDGTRAYWYENGVRQGSAEDPKGVWFDGTNRGREIYDPESDAWYWLDAVYDGAKATGKEVFMPYIYQGEETWDDTTIRENASASDAGMEEFVYETIKNRRGKWVRYDEDGKMLKGWVTIEGNLAELYPDQAGNTYYYDNKTGLMAKGWITLDGQTCHFDETTGALIR